MMSKKDSEEKLVEEREEGERAFNAKTTRTVRGTVNSFSEAFLMPKRKARIGNV